MQIESISPLERGERADAEAGSLEGRRLEPLFPSAGLASSDRNGSFKRWGRGVAWATALAAGPLLWGVGSIGCGERYNLFHDSGCYLRDGGVLITLVFYAIFGIAVAKPYGGPPQRTALARTSNQAD